MSEQRPKEVPEKDEAESEEEISIADIEARRAARLAHKEMNPFLKMALIAAVVVAAFIFSLSGFFTVVSIDVEGNSYYTDDEIINMAHASVGNNLIYDLPKREMTNYLEANPYIKNAKVSRSFPNTILITVEEREQAAALTYDDEYLLIDHEGIVLRRTETRPKITIVTGFKVESMDLGERIQVEEKDLFEELLVLLDKAEAGDLYFDHIVMDDYMIQAAVLPNLVVRADDKDLEEVIDKGHLKRIIEELFDRNIKRGTIVVSEDGYASFSPGVS